MPVWQLGIRIALGFSLLVLAGCGSGASDRLEPTEPAKASGLFVNTWQPGIGFLIDRQERLFLTTNRLVNQQKETEIAFSVIEDGKVLARKSAWLTKARGDRTVRAKVLIADPDRDLAILQLPSVPDGVPELKLAKSEPEKGAAVQFLGAASGDIVWAPAASSVESIAARKMEIEKNKNATNQMIELTADAGLAKGVAGGAVVNEQGEVVGMIAAGLPERGHMLCTDLSELRPVVAAAYRTLAMRAYQQGKYDKAIAYSVRGLEAWPEDPLGYNERGAAYSQKDEFDKAILDYTQAIKLEPQLPLPYRNRGSAYFHQGKYKESVADCTKAIQLSPNYQSAYRTRSQAYAKLKMKKEAKEDDQTIAILTKSQQKNEEWQGTTISGDPNVPSSDSGTGFYGSVMGKTSDGRTIGLRPPVPGDPYYRGADGKRYIVIGRYGSAAYGRK